jgi:hydrogenase/urease accessory protein HupE
MEITMNKSLVGSFLLLASLPVLAHSDGEHPGGILATLLHLFSSADHLLTGAVLVASGLLAAWVLQKPALRAIAFVSTLAGAILLFGSV